MADWYPQSMDARAGWHANFVAHLVSAIFTKYGIPTAAVTQVNDDNIWLQYWVDARHEADSMMQGLTKYFNTIAGKDPAADPPAPVTWAFSLTAPPEVPPGIEFRVREIAKQIKGHAAYAVADGELLGIITPTDAPTDPASLTPTFKLRTLAEFKLEATFRKLGMEALRFEARHKDEAWQPAAFLINSPGQFTFVPKTPGVAEQIEVRAILVQKNQDVGNFSAIVAGFIAP